MIKPTIGRVVWYRPNKYDDAFAFYQVEPLAAMVVRVWNDRMVNLVVFDPNGLPLSRTSVRLIQEGDPIGSESYCEWMPYQLGQAKAAGA